MGLADHEASSRPRPRQAHNTCATKQLLDYLRAAKGDEAADELVEWLGSWRDTAAIVAAYEAEYPDCMAMTDSTTNRHRRRRCACYR